VNRGQVTFEDFQVPPFGPYPFADLGIIDDEKEEDVRRASNSSLDP